MIASRRILTLAVLCAGVLLHSPAGAADEAAETARKLLASCRRSETTGGVRFACEGLAASVSEYSDLSPQAALDVHVGAMKTLGTVSSTSADFSAGGKRWLAIRFYVRRADGDLAFEGRAAALAIRSNVARLVSCGGSAARLSPCDAILSLLAASGPEPYAVPKVEPSFLGRKVPIPKGCRVLNASESSFRIQCGELAGVAFMRLEAADHIERFADTMREQLLKNLPGSTEDQPRGCQIGGVPSQCKVILVGTGAGRGSFFIGGAVVQGVPISVQCFQSALVKGVHPVCASMFAL